MITEIVFWVIAVLLVISALAVVLMRNVFRAALLLVLSFFAVAGIYITLNADFLAAAQVLIYAGAIGVLLIFAIMLTRDLQQGNPFNKINAAALLIALLIMAVFVSVIVTTDWNATAKVVADVPQELQVPVDEPTTSGIAQALFDRDNGFVLPFEIASVLLLAALIGAIVLVRHREKE